VYDGLGGYGPAGGSGTRSRTAYVLGAYLFPATPVPEIPDLGKYGRRPTTSSATISTGHARARRELLIKQFNARISLYYLDKSFDPKYVGAAPRRSSSACKSRCKEKNDQ
jgi:hypothetical protein